MLRRLWRLPTWRATAALSVWLLGHNVALVLTTRVVEVSINGESFSADGFAFHEVLLTSLDVTSGPIFGGTTVQVVGTGFID